MPKAGEIAQELRRIADALDKEPETELARPMLSLYNHNSKDKFLASVRLLPRPMQKTVNDREYIIEAADKNVIWLSSTVERSAVCTIVKPAQPAVYDCEPLLSEAEEAILV